MSKFAIGSRVIVNRTSTYIITKPGKTGTVLDLNNTLVKVSWDDPSIIEDYEVESSCLNLLPSVVFSEFETVYIRKDDTNV